MDSIKLEELRIAKDSARNKYFQGLRNHGEAYYNMDMQNAEATHERLERLYNKYLDARRAYDDALDEFFDTHLMTDYTSL